MTKRPKNFLTPAGTTPEQVARRYNRWRDQFNPLRGMSLSRTVTLKEAFDRGEMADIQWTFRSIERSDADLMALILRRTSAIREMDWKIKTVSDDRPDWDEALADAQQEYLRAVYDKIANLYECVVHLSLAAFRGFSHLAIQWDDQTGFTGLEPVDQWNVVRFGTRGPWKYNQDAASVSFTSLPDDSVIQAEQVILLTDDRPINLFALPKYVRTGLGEKDWTAFAEIYGIPSGVVIMPPNIPPGEEVDYAEKAASIAEGGSGALPNGSDYKANDGPRGVNPFRAFLDYFTEKLILVGTGGKLTMLAESGSGTLAGGAHEDTFRTIANDQARQISEAFQRQLDAQLIEDKFPGKPVLAYFELEFQTESNTGEIVEHALKLSQAGYQMDADELSERTGYKLSPKPQPAALNALDPAKQEPHNGDPDPAKTEEKPEKVVTNRENVPPTNALAKALAADLQAVRNRLAELLKHDDPATWQQAVASAKADILAMAPKILANPSSAVELERTIADGFAQGVQKGAKA